MKHSPNTGEKTTLRKDGRKIEDKHFIDWEGEIFGYGYGTGEEYTLLALKMFFDTLTEDRNYDYEQLEKKMGHMTAWLMINILCHADIIEYGPSPRFGWISKKGKLLGEYIKGKTVDELYDKINTDENYIHCYKGICNCDKPCNNPLF